MGAKKHITKDAFLVYFGNLLVLALDLNFNHRNDIWRDLSCNGPLQDFGVLLLN